MNIRDKWEEIQKKENYAGVADEVAILTYAIEAGEVIDYREMMRMQKKLEERDCIERLLDDYEVFREMGEEEYAAEILDELEKMIDGMYFRTLMDGEYDKNGAIVTLHAGEGGDEAEDWTAMMSRMYLMWAKKNGFKATILDEIDSEIGMKKISFEILGDFAYGYLKGEAGAHRLVRISPFDSKGRRHTSFCAVEVIPELNDIIPEIIKISDCETQTFRSGGPGGQHQNKTESGVRLIHKPTGLIAECREERSQIQNKEKCLKMLQGMLIEQQEKEAQEKAQAFSNDGAAAWGNAIRSYVFMPYQMVKDNRSGYETGRIDDVMNGEIMEMMEAGLGV